MNSPATACSRQSTLLADARPRYLASTLEDLTFGGKTYGFPMYSNVAVIAYNTQIFKAAAIPHAPRDLDEQLRSRARSPHVPARQACALPCPRSTA
jgi:maltose-binding protein MalE